MADQKISELTEVTTPAVTDVIAVVTGGITKKVTLGNVRKILDWDQHIVKAVDQDVTNSVALVDDTELQFAMTAGDIWYVELHLVYSGSSAAVDFKLNFVLPTVEGWLRGQGLSTGNTAQAQSAALVAAIATTDITLGTLASTAARRHALVEMGFVVGATSTFKVQFANSTAGVGNISRSCIGSLLRAKKIA